MTHRTDLLPYCLPGKTAIAWVLSFCKSLKDFRQCALVSSAGGYRPPLWQHSWGWGGRAFRPVIWPLPKHSPRLTWLGSDSRCTETHFTLYLQEATWVTHWRDIPKSQNETSSYPREGGLPVLKGNLRQHLSHGFASLQSVTFVEAPGH